MYAVVSFPWKFRFPQMETLLPPHGNSIYTPGVKSRYYRGKARYIRHVNAFTSNSKFVGKCYWLIISKLTRIPLAIFHS